MCYCICLPLCAQVEDVCMLDIEIPAVFHSRGAEAATDALLDNGVDLEMEASAEVRVQLALGRHCTPHSIISSLCLIVHSLYVCSLGDPYLSRPSPSTVVKPLVGSVRDVGQPFHDYWPRPRPGNTPAWKGDENSKAGQTPVSGAGVHR